MANFDFIPLLDSISKTVNARTRPNIFFEFKGQSIDIYF